MALKEHEQNTPIVKYLIPPCIALPFNLTLLKNHESGNCTAVTEKGECPHAKRRHHVPDKFECDKNTKMRNDVRTGLPGLVIQ